MKGRSVLQKGENRSPSLPGIDGLDVLHTRIADIDADASISLDEEIRVATMLLRAAKGAGKAWDLPLKMTQGTD